MTQAIETPSGLYLEDLHVGQRFTSGSFYGSAQEFVRVCILCGFLESDEFGLSGSQALRLQQQIVHVSITAAAAEQSFDVAVDGFHHSHRYLRPAIVQN